MKLKDSDTFQRAKMWKEEERMQEALKLQKRAAGTQHVTCMSYYLYVYATLLLPSES